MPDFLVFDCGCGSDGIIRVHVVTTQNADAAMGELIRRGINGMHEVESFLDNDNTFWVHVFTE